MPLAHTCTTCMLQQSCTQPHSGRTSPEPHSLPMASDLPLPALSHPLYSIRTPTARKILRKTGYFGCANLENKFPLLLPDILKRSISFPGHLSGETPLQDTILWNNLPASAPSVPGPFPGLRPAALPEESASPPPRPDPSLPFLRVNLLLSIFRMSVLPDRQFSPRFPAPGILAFLRANTERVIPGIPPSGTGLARYLRGCICRLQTSACSAPSFRTILLDSPGLHFLVLICSFRPAFCAPLNSHLFLPDTQTGAFSRISG